MNRFLSVCLLLVLMLLIVGCGKTINKNHLFAEPGISMQAHLEPTVEINMDEVLKGKANATYLLGKIRIAGDSKYADGFGSSQFSTPIGPDVESVKSAAAYNAIKTSEADVLINPKYTVDVTNTLLLTQVSVSVSGYAGYIKDIKQIGIKDIRR